MNLLRSDPVLAVKDLDCSAAWFVDVLGCDKTEPDPGNWAFCTAGNVTFMLGRCPDAIPASELGDHSYVAYLTVDAVDGYYLRALAEQAEVLKPPTDEPWGRREMALRTPDGHRIMLSERSPKSARTIRIGRQPDNDIVLAEDPDVSRHHAELHRNPDGSFELVDLGSHNGTYVNGKRITRTTLTEQDTISIGHATFQLSGGELR